MNTFNPELTYGIVSAHPDDHIPHSHLLETAAQYDSRIHEIVHTRGRNGINLSNAIDVADGSRELEGRRSSEYLGIRSYRQLDAADGGLSGTEARMAIDTAGWALTHGIDVLVTMDTGDHPDHAAALRAGRLAARILLAEGVSASVLELQPADRPQYDEYDGLRFDGSPNGLARAVGAARRNPSQFQVQEGIHDDWPLVAGYSLEPATYHRLIQYPLLGDATYRVVTSQHLQAADTVRYTGINHQEQEYDHAAV